jgi:solute carrier family 10 (sodium/bile acid cotransporter), member 7
MLLAWLTRHWFLLGLGGVALFAYLFPEVGARGGFLRSEITTKAAVAVVFLLQGLVITPAALRTGAMRWRLHLVLQVVIFVLFPLTVILLDAVGGGLLPPDLRLGFLFLAVLPTTISTCVVFTTIAGGNASGALFNSVLANLSGIVVTPLWAALLLSARGETLPFGPMMAEIATLILLPLLVGQALRPLARSVGEPRPKAVAALSSAIILFIVFAAFSNSFASGAFVQTGAGATAAVVAVALVVFSAATAAMVLLGTRLRFDEGDRRALLFCGPQKTLAAGAPMAQILFAGNPAIGLILLPVIVYHAVQLLGGAVLAQRLAAAPAPPT